MTYRAKPVVRPRRRAWDSPDRRNFLLNLGFGLVVVVAFLVLGIAAFASWYGEHLATVASINGQGITKDDLRQRMEVELARLSLAESRIADEINAGRISREQGEQQLGFIGQRREQVHLIALERLIDDRIQGDLVAQEGIQITDADIDARLTEEATRPEQRHAWVIEVTPEIEAGATEPTSAAIAEARAKAEQAADDVAGGKAWEEVSKAVSTAAGADTGGDLGWIADDADLDTAFRDALFALEADGVTDVLEGEDDVFRIGRVTEIAEETIDPDYLSLIVDRGIEEDVYRSAVRVDVQTEKLREKIDAQALAAGPQRDVLEIFLENRDLPAALPAGAVKARHILYAPKDDAQGAQTLPPDDPAWTEAGTAAQAAYDRLKADPTKFDEIARKESDEDGADVSGGKLPWFDPSQLQSAGGTLDDKFGAAIFASGLQPGQVLTPVQSAFGWHVIQIMYTIPDIDQAKLLKAEAEGGKDFGQLARDYSNTPESAEGGALGWIARFQVDQASEQAIFATAIGQITEPVAVDGRGVYLYKVLKEETRTPEGDQKDQLEQTAFTNWYEAKKAAYTIERDPEFESAG